MVVNTEVLTHIFFIVYTESSHEIKTLVPWKKSYDKPRQHIKKQKHYFTNQVPYSQTYGFSTSHVWMWKLDYKESWALKNWGFLTVVLEKTWDSLGLQGDPTSQS